MKLYEITNDIRELQAMADAGDLTAEEIKDTMDALELSQADKIEGCLMVRQDLLGDAAKFAEEAARLQAMAKYQTDAAKRLEDYIKSSLVATDTSKIDAGLFRVTLRKATVKLGELDESKIPDGYFVEIPASKKVDKRLLLSDAKLKRIQGVTLTESSRSLTIK